MRRLLKVLTLGLSMVAATSWVDLAHAERSRSGFVRGGSGGGASSSRNSSWHGSGRSSSRDHATRDRGYLGGTSRDRGYRGGTSRERGYQDRGYQSRGSRGYGYRDHGYRDNGYRSRRYPHRGYHGSYRYRGYYPYSRYYTYPRWYSWGFSSWYGLPYLGWYVPSPWYWNSPRYYSYPDSYGYRSGSHDDDAPDGGWRGWGGDDSAERSEEPREWRGSESRPEQSSGMLRLRTSPGAAIYVDDRFAGAADANGVLMLEIEDGTHSFAAVQPKQPTLARSIKVGPDTKELWLDR